MTHGAQNSFLEDNVAEIDFHHYSCMQTEHEKDAA